MLAVTIGASGRVSQTSRRRFSMDALTIIRQLSGVALPASLGDFGAPDLRGRVARRKNVMGTMAVRANRAFFSRCNGTCVNALQVGFHRTKHRYAKFFRQEHVPMATRTGCRDIVPIYRRSRIGPAHNLMNIAMATRTGRGLGKPGGAGPGMNALGVCFYACGVAAIALRGLKFGLVGNSCNVAMTGCTIKCAVNGPLIARAVDLKRDGLAVARLVEPGNPVATQASVLGHSLGANGADF